MHAAIDTAACGLGPLFCVGTLACPGCNFVHQFSGFVFVIVLLPLLAAVGCACFSRCQQPRRLSMGMHRMPCASGLGPAEIHILRSLLRLYSSRHRDTVREEVKPFPSDLRRRGAPPVRARAEVGPVFLCSGRLAPPPAGKGSKPAWSPHSKFIEVPLLRGGRLTGLSLTREFILCSFQGFYLNVSKPSLKSRSKLQSLGMLGMCSRL